MKRLILMIIFLSLMSGICYAIAENTKYSYKDYTNKKLLDVDVKELNNTIIRGSCFYQEKSWDYALPWVKTFPDGLTGVTFDRCNLDNVKIPDGNIILPTCSHKIIKIQNDWSDWLMDETNKPKEPINKKEYLELGISIDPKNISDKKLNKSIIDSKKEEIALDEK